MTHPLHDVAIVGVHNTRQARSLEGETPASIQMDAVRGVLADSGVDISDVDGIADTGHNVVYDLKVGPAWLGGYTNKRTWIGILMDAAAAIATGQATTVLMVDGWAGVYTDHSATAPWTRQWNGEFIAPWGVFTAVEFALLARRHMELYGTTPEQLATVSATIRNNGHMNPEAVYHGRGPFTVEDVLASRMVADPFHLLDCSMTAEGGSAMILTTAERAKDLRQPPVYVLGGGIESFGSPYTYPPVLELSGRDPELTLGTIGRRAAQRSFAAAGLTPADVDVCEFYDPFSWEVIRQFEAFGFCDVGEGGPFVESGAIAMDGAHPTTTDGGTMSFSHALSAQMLQRVIRGVQQIRGTCPTQQVEGAEVAMCSNGGAGGYSLDVVLLGGAQP